MEHQDFVRAWTGGLIEVSVDRSKALRIANSYELPKRYRYAHMFWSWIWFLTIPVGIGVMIFYKWWVGLLILFIVTPAISSATKKSAMEFVIEVAVEDPAFYEIAIEEKILMIYKKP